MIQLSDDCDNIPRKSENFHNDFLLFTEHEHTKMTRESGNPLNDLLLLVEIFSHVVSGPYFQRRASFFCVSCEFLSYQVSNLILVNYSYANSIYLQACVLSSDERQTENTEKTERGGGQGEPNWVE